MFVNWKAIPAFSAKATARSRSAGFRTPHIDRQASPTADATFQQYGYKSASNVSNRTGSRSASTPSRTASR